MTNHDVTPQEALLRLGASTAEAVAQVIETLAPGLVQRGEVSVLTDGSTAFENLPFGAVAASASYIDGVTGANVFLMSPAAARALARTITGAQASEEDRPELSSEERSAVAQAADQMMSAAASAISVVLGQEVTVSPAETRVVDDTDSAINAFGSAPHATSTTFLLGDQACRLVQLVPSPFVVRMARAIDELSIEQAVDPDSGGGAGSGQQGHGGGALAEPVAVHDALAGITLRVWAELGRARLPLGYATELPLGSVVDLDRAADAPVEIFVNGLRFGQGRLLVTDDGEWAVSLQRLGAEPDLTAA